VGDRIFAWLAAQQGEAPWGRVLDAGTGAHSLRWIAGLGAERWTAVTGEPTRAEELTRDLGPRRRPADRVVVGDWADPDLLAGEVFDVVVADYLLGALEGQAPYLQDRLFERLRPHVGGRLYVVGLEPYPARADDPWGALVLDVARLRDAAIVLAGDRCYREYPLPWVRRRLEAAGLRVAAEATFPIRYGERFIDRQLAVAERRLPRIGSAALTKAIRREAAALRKRGRALAAERTAFGADYALAAEPARPGA